MPDLDTVLAWRGKTVLDRDGEKAGTLGALYLDEHEQQDDGGDDDGGSHARGATHSARWVALRHA